MNEPSDMYMKTTKPRSFTVHHTNIQTLLHETYKLSHNLPERCLKDLFSPVNSNCNVRS